ncbi:MAG: hypothetical protein ABFD69_02435 [Candidatus Sumerlaeia bacterium]
MTAFRRAVLIALFAMPLLAFASRADRPTTAVLHFEPGGFSESIAAAKGEVAFSAEPKYAGTNLVRGSIQVGTRKMGYVLDQSTKTLYLDLNINGNLTDDPAGAIKSTNAGTYYIDFNNVPVSLKTNGLTIPYKLSMIFNMGAAPIISMRSGWGGQYRAGRPEISSRNRRRPQWPVRARRRAQGEAGGELAVHAQAER